jgi:hypothetical protein
VTTRSAWRRGDTARWRMDQVLRTLENDDDEARPWIRSWLVRPSRAPARRAGSSPVQRGEFHSILELQMSPDAFESLPSLPCPSYSCNERPLQPRQPSDPGWDSQLGPSRRVEIEIPLPTPTTGVHDRHIDALPSPHRSDLLPATGARSGCSHVDFGRDGDGVGSVGGDVLARYESRGDFYWSNASVGSKGGGRGRGRTGSFACVGDGDCADGTRGEDWSIDWELERGRQTTGDGLAIRSR